MTSTEIDSCALVVLDATHTCDRSAPDGSLVTAAELARVTATNLHGELVTVVTTEELLRWSHQPALEGEGRRGGP